MPTGSGILPFRACKQTKSFNNCNVCGYLSLGVQEVAFLIIRLGKAMILAQPVTIRNRIPPAHVHDRAHASAPLAMDILICGFVSPGCITESIILFVRNGILSCPKIIRQRHKMDWTCMSPQVSYFVAPVERAMVHANQLPWIYCAVAGDNYFPPFGCTIFGSDQVGNGCSEVVGGCAASL